jgi:hypothetical protein
VPLIKKDNARVDDTPPDARLSGDAETATEPQGPQLVGSKYPEDAREPAPAKGSMDIEAVPLFSSNELGELRKRWDRIQTGFVDEPRNAVQQADTLVASAMQRLTDVFASERTKLEQQWERGDSISTEDLRVALQRYRSFFHRLLSV